MRGVILMLLFAVLCISFVSKGQIMRRISTNESLTLEQKVEVAKDLIERKQYYPAYKMYLDIYESSPDEKSIYQLAELSRKLNYYQKSSSYYKQLTKFPEYPLALFYLAEMNLFSGNYSEAEQLFQQFIRQYPQAAEVNDAKNYLDLIENALNIKQQPIDAAINLIPDTRNTTAAVIAGTDIYYSQPIEIKVSEKLKRTYYNLVYDTLYALRIMQGQVSQNNINGSQVMELEEDDHYNVANPAFTSDQDRMYFTQCNLIEDEPCKIYYTDKRSSGWSKPRALGEQINMPGTNNKDVSVFYADGAEHIIFSSDRAGGNGGYDIWYSRKESKFESPVHLSSNINTEKDERSPYILFDSLFFSSEGHAGLGGFDIYKTEFLYPTFDGEVNNIGYPINSAANDLYYFTTDYYNAYFTSNRNTGCCNELFQANIRKSEQIKAPEIDEPVAVVPKDIGEDEPDVNEEIVVSNEPAITVETPTKEPPAPQEFKEEESPTAFIPQKNVLFPPVMTYTEFRSLLSKNPTLVGDVLLKVQIGAYRNPPYGYFAKIKTFEIVTENHDNLTKFLTGNYYNLVEAEKRRTEAVRAGINDAFIAVYYNGQRVSILRKM